MHCLVVDFGMGNLRSIQHKLKKLDMACSVGSQPADVQAADMLILPGVGHFATGMANLHRLGLVDALTRKVMEEKTPVLGICLGMQLFSRSSEEGGVGGLGWIDADTRRFDFRGLSPDLRIPHIGWNLLEPKRDSPLLRGVTPDQKFYFIHSYHVCCRHPEDVLTTTRYGIEFVSSVWRENIFGVQFHPEKSHRRGIELVRNFISFAAGSRVTSPGAGVRRGP